MVNLKNAITFGLLAATASAATVHKGKRHHHHKRGTKVPCTTSETPFPAGNSTIPAGTGAASSTSQQVVTVSVIPVPVSSNAGTTSTGAPAGSSPANTQPAVSTPAVSTPALASSQPAVSPPVGSAPSGSAPAGSECGVATTYVTVQQTVTVTAGQIPESTSSSSTVEITSTSTYTSVVTVSATSSSSSSSAPVAIQSPPVASSSTSVAPVVAPTPVVSSTASSVPAPSSSPVSSGSTVGGTYSGKKMGTSWNPNQNAAFDALGVNVGASWVYDWGQVANGVPSGVEYVPTLHDSSQCAGFASKLEGSGATWVKHFNEPDTGSDVGGCGLSPAQAAQLHNQYIAPLMDQYNIGLPAVTSNNIPGSSGTGWLESFVGIVGCEKFKFADFHFYGGGEAVEDQANIFLSYVENWKSVVEQICPGQNLPIWISEFSAGPATGDAGVAATFMGVAGPKLDADPAIARYAYFFPDNSQISGALSAITKALSALGLGDLVG